MAVIWGRPLTSGTAQGAVLTLSSPLSLWGGVNLEDGVICDVSHAERGHTIKGAVLAMPSGRGSSSSSSALLECVRIGTAPAAIILMDLDPILVMGGLAAREVYGVNLPITLLNKPDYETVSKMRFAKIRSDVDMRTEINLGL